MNSAILFSGGLDSTCAAILAPRASLVRVSIGSRYDAVERARADAVCRALGRELLHIDGVLDLGRYEAEDALVPARNAMIVLAAAQHFPNVELVSVSGDGTHATDKDSEFAELMTKLLRKLMGRGEVTVPWRTFSKTYLVQAAKRRFPDQLSSVLPHVFSCYSPTGDGMHCGKCKACVRLWGALLASGCDPSAPGFDSSPAELGYTMLEQVYEGRGAERDEALAAYAQAMGG